MIKSPIYVVSSAIFVILLLGCEQHANGANKMYHQAQILERSSFILLVGKDDIGSIVSLENDKGELVKRKSLSTLPSANSIYCPDSICWIGGGRGLIGAIAIVDSSLSSEINEIPKVLGGEIYSLSYIPHSDQMVLGHATGEVGFIPRNKVSGVMTIKVADSEIFAVAYNKYIDMVVCGDERGKLYFISSDQDHKVVSSVPGKGAVFSISTFDTKKILIGRSTGEIQLFDVETKTSKTLFSTKGSAAVMCDSDQELNTVVCGMSDGNVFYIDIEKNLSKNVMTHDSKIIAIKQIAGNRAGISVDANGEVKKWNF